MIDEGQLAGLVVAAGIATGVALHAVLPNRLSTAPAGERTGTLGL
jgi:hypothetical protein